MKYVHMILDNIWLDIFLVIPTVLIVLFGLLYILDMKFGPKYEDFCRMAGFSPNDAVEMKKK